MTSDGMWTIEDLKNAQAQRKKSACENCKYCEIIKGPVPVYECRKSPPVLVVLPHGLDGSSFQFEFPTVEHDTYCWEYKAKDAKRSV